MHRQFRPSSNFECDCAFIGQPCFNQTGKSQLISWNLPTSPKPRCINFTKKSIKGLLNNIKKYQTKIKLINQDMKQLASSLESQKRQKPRELKRSNFCFKSAIIGCSPAAHFHKPSQQKQQNSRKNQQPRITFNLYQSNLDKLSTRNTYLNGQSQKPIFIAEEKKKRSSKAKVSSIQGSSQRKSQFVSVKYNQSSSFVVQNKDQLQQAPKLNRVHTLDPKLIQSEQDSEQESDLMSQVIMHYSPSLENPQTSDSPIGFDGNLKLWSHFLSKDVKQ